MKRQLSLLATLALTDVLKRLHKALLLARNCLEHQDLGEKETWVSIKARFGHGYQIGDSVALHTSSQETLPHPLLHGLSSFTCF